MRQIRFLEEARSEFLAEVVYYEKLQRGLGGRFQAAVEKATSIAVAFPLAGSPSASETRRVIAKGFPFFVVYRPEGNEIVVFAVAHFRRKPDYWRERKCCPTASSSGQKTGYRFLPLMSDVEHHKCISQGRWHFPKANSKLPPALQTLPASRTR